MKLSVIIPVYNEKDTVLELLRRVKNAPFDKEILVVDDGSTDGSRRLIQDYKEGGITALYHDKNLGKGAAIRTALPKVTGEIVLIQDADLEYDPADYKDLLGPLFDGRADVVYGSRFLGGPHRVLFYWHYVGNRLFTFLTNILYNINLTDMGTCYKAFRTEALKGLRLRSDRFGFEPEVTAKVCKKKLRIYETPISYSGRSYAEGKKITWRDGLVYFYCLLKYRIFD